MPSSQSVKITIDPPSTIARAAEILQQLIGPVSEAPDLNFCVELVDLDLSILQIVAAAATQVRASGGTMRLQAPLTGVGLDLCRRAGVLESQDWPLSMGEVP